MRKILYVILDGNRVPISNKSNREHQITGTVTADVRREAGLAVKQSGLKGSHYVLGNAKDRQLQTQSVLWSHTAGDRNRTDMTSLEGWSFTTKLRPQLFI